MKIHSSKRILFAVEALNAYYQHYAFWHSFIAFLFWTPHTKYVFSTWARNGAIKQIHFNAQPNKRGKNKSRIRSKTGFISPIHLIFANFFRFFSPFQKKKKSVAFISWKHSKIHSKVFLFFSSRFVYFVLEF